MLRFRAALGLLFLLGACAGGAAPPEPIAPAAAPPVAAAPDGQAAAVAPAARPAGTAIGYLLVDLATGRELAALNPDLPLVPASTAKLATAVVALDVLGPGHRFRTELLAGGAVRGGVLHGDLILTGGGDPALDVADLLGLAVRLRASGVHRVAGRFLVDDTALPRLTEIAPSQPPEAAYNPGLGALSLAFNRVRVAWRGGPAGAPAGAPATLPPLAEARLEAAPPARLPPGGVELEGAGDGAVLWRVADGGGGRRRELALPVKDPGLHAGHVFRRLALGQGVELGPPRRGPAPPGAHALAVHEGAPLDHLVRAMLVYSNNVMAELIGLAAAARLGGGAPPDLAAAGALLLAHLGRLMPAVDWRGAALGNGSGLDGAARLTPRQLAAILRYGWRREALPALLPGGGWSGTLAGRFVDGDAALRVWAKTGSLHYGGALAGYLFPAGGRPAVFATLVADPGARAAYDGLGRPDAAAEAAAHAWNARARALQDELVGGWLEPPPAG